MVKSLKFSTAAFGIILLAAAPSFAQNAPPPPAGQPAKPAAGSPQTPAGDHDKTPVHRVKCGEGTYIEQVRGHEVCDEPGTGRPKMVTPTGKHEKM